MLISQTFLFPRKKKTFLKIQTFKNVTNAQINTCMFTPPQTAQPVSLQSFEILSALVHC